MIRPIHEPGWKNLWGEYLEVATEVPLDRWLSQRLKKEKSWGRADRRFYAEWMFAAVRGAYRWLRMCSSSYWNKRPWQEFVSWSVHGTGQDLAKALQSISSQEIWNELQRDPAYKESESLESKMLASGFPLRFRDALLARAKESQWSEQELELFIQRHAFRPKLWIRFNYPEKRGEVEREFREVGLRLHEESGGYYIQGNQSLFDLKSFQSGIFEIQDRASQSIGEMFLEPWKNLSPAERSRLRILDFCAGEGGKTLQIASGLRGKGEIKVFDLYEEKLNRLKQRASRAGYSNIQIAKPKDCDGVLVDAPCSSLGVLRRDPDWVFRLKESSIAQVQRDVLHAASDHVRVGGWLVYATCSWRVEENEGVVREFLETHDEFELEAMTVHGNPKGDSDTTFSARFRKAMDPNGPRVGFSR